MTRSTRSRSRRAPETKPLPLDLLEDESGEDLLVVLANDQLAVAPRSRLQRKRRLGGQIR